ncbi:hypothetical protein [Klebsiella pneumoniae]|uniref:hypothetical protein n=1 Tax=Klebsiella pneumoniae TaxID=573 RepID=UPI0022B689AD|nr:hypothetical protein [Klebsiella pneumoniae]
MQKPKKKPLVVKILASGSDGKSDASGTGGRDTAEQMAELERSARSHFADIGGEDGG